MPPPPQQGVYDLFNAGLQFLDYFTDARPLKTKEVRCFETSEINNRVTLLNDREYVILHFIALRLLRDSLSALPIKAKRKAH